MSLNKHFRVVHEDAYFENPSFYNSKIQAILPLIFKPTITEELIKSMPNLKIVATISAGYNHLGSGHRMYCTVHVCNID